MMDKTGNQISKCRAYLLASQLTAEQLFGGIAPMSPSAVVYNNNCYVFYLNAQQNLSYKFADGTSWSNEGVVPDVPNSVGMRAV